jgi:hypothetical protein
MNCGEAIAGGRMAAWFEDLPLDLGRAETKRATRLLLAAFNRADPLLNFAHIVGLNTAALNAALPPKYLVPEILKQARLSDRMPLLIAEVFNDPDLVAIHPEFRELTRGHEATLDAAILRRKPSLETLALLPSSIEVWASNASAPTPLAEPGLEKTINQAAGFADPAAFRMNLAQAEVRTARIEIGGKPKGTGFLVADSFILTNWHVVKNGVNGAVAVFDKKVGAAGIELAGRQVKFSDDWLIASSVHESVPIEIGPDGPPAGNWDFALVRLAEPVGGQAIGPDPHAASGDKRGHYRLDGNAYDFDKNEPLFILGHPEGRPTQFSYASPSGATQTKSANRIRYYTNTEGGSSGSPVYNKSWRVVALHHASGPTKIAGEFNFQANPFNQGIPIRGIVEELKKQLDGKPELAALGLA